MVISLSDRISIDAWAATTSKAPSAVAYSAPASALREIAHCAPFGGIS
jgi:hypothetical protein